MIREYAQVALGRQDIRHHTHRVDFFYTPAGKILVNEVNTMPGMTPASGFPMMWAATGLPLPQLVDRIIQTALRKRPRALEGCGLRRD